MTVADSTGTRFLVEAAGWSLDFRGSAFKPAPRGGPGHPEQSRSSTAIASSPNEGSSQNIRRRATPAKIVRIDALRDEIECVVN